MALNRSGMLEKTDAENILESPLTNIDFEDETFGFHYDRQVDRKVLLRLDLLVQPIIFVMCVFLFLDRANVGNARVAGMQKSLGLTDSQYQICQFSCA